MDFTSADIPIKPSVFVDEEKQQRLKLKYSDGSYVFKCVDESNNNFLEQTEDYKCFWRCKVCMHYI